MTFQTRQGELPWPKAFDTFCDSQDQIYEIVKSVNFTACKNKPVLAHSTAAGLYGRAGDNAMGSALEVSQAYKFKFKAFDAILGLFGTCHILKPVHLYDFD